MSSLWLTAPGSEVTGTVALADGQQAPEADDVVAGWSGFIVIAALVVATGFLIRSMSKHLRRIDFDDKPQQPGPRQDGRQQDGPQQEEPEQDDTGTGDDGSRRR